VEHLHHFQLKDDPFRNDPLLRLFFESGPQQDALRRLERGVRQSKALSVLVGPSGAGKTMVLRQLLDRLEEEVFEACMMVVLHGAADAGWILRRFARQLGVEDASGEREQVLAQIYEQLAIVREDGRHTVLLIDDAEALAQPGALAEVCGLLKLEYDDRRLLSLVLAGPPLLDAAFSADPVLGHRIDVRVALDSLTPAATSAYLDHRIRNVGGDPKILDPEAVRALYELGGGYPGRMNTLADNAMFEAFLCGRAQLTRVDVERAHRDLGWSVAPTASEASTPPLPLTELAPASVAKGSGEIITGMLTDSGVDAGDGFAGAPPLNPLQETLDELDSELAAVFEHPPRTLGEPLGSAFGAEIGPPKDGDSEPEDLLVELVDD
jgi:type II secretory pathway predicted ATPase ExeA